MRGVGKRDLFGSGRALPAGLKYRPGLLSGEEERALVERIEPLPFAAFQFHGHVGKRRVVSFGWRYDFAEARLHEAEGIPDFLLPVRDKAARFAGVDPDAFVHVLVTEYPAGAAIGWHKDKGVFGTVAGISLLSPCVFRLRRRQGAAWERASLLAEPGSAYLLEGPSRTEWEHSIPPVEGLRYSITFRSLKEG